MFPEPVDDVPFDKLSDGVTRRSEVVQERSAVRHRPEFAWERIGALLPDRTRFSASG